jgi:hypothetical protein
MPEYGILSEFLTETEHHRFRAITTFLFMTNALDEDTAESHVNNYTKRNKKDAVTYGHLAEFTELLVRDSEVVALYPVVKEGVITAVQNTVPDADEAEDEKDDTGCVAFLEKSPPATAEMDKSPAMWLLNRTVEHKKTKQEESTYGDPKTNLSLGDHGATLISLLKNTWESNHRSNIRALEQYMIITCCAKIRGRMRRGNTSKRRFVQYLTAPTADLEAILTAGTSTLFMLASSAYDKEFDDREKGALKIILDTIVKKKVDQPELLSRWNQAVDSQATMWYNKDTRLMFHSLVAVVVGTAWKRMDAVYKLKEETQREYLKINKKARRNTKIESIARALDIAALDTGLWMRMLFLLEHESGLREILTKHLAWLRDLHQLPYAATYRNRAPACIIPRVGVIPESSTRPSGSEQEYDDDDNDNDDNLHASYPKYDEVDTPTYRANWSKATLKYLDICCRHHVCMYTLARYYPSERNEHVRQLLKKASFQWIRHRQTKQDDKRMISLDTWFAIVEKENRDRLEASDIESLKSWITQHSSASSKPTDSTWTSETDFTGTFHSTTLLLSHHLLGLNRDRLVTSEKKEQQSEYLTLPDKDITSQLSTPIQFLPISTPCCPACAQLISYLQRRRILSLSDNLIMYLGSQPKWTPTSLPPWLPRDAGLQVLWAAEAKARKRIGKIVPDFWRNWYMTSIFLDPAYCTP